jgi:hypothetical protein
MDTKFIKYMEDMFNQESFDKKRSNRLYKNLLQRFQEKRRFNIKDAISFSFLALAIVALGISINTVNKQNISNQINDIDRLLQSEIVLDSQEIDYMDDIDKDLDMLLEEF